MHICRSHHSVRSHIQSNSTFHEIRIGTLVTMSLAHIAQRLTNLAPSRSSLASPSFASYHPNSPFSHCPSFASAPSTSVASQNLPERPTPTRNEPFTRQGTSPPPTGSSRQRPQFQEMVFGFDGPDLSAMGRDKTPTASKVVETDGEDTVRQTRWELASVLN
jgi:hypothetical protein